MGGGPPISERDAIAELGARLDATYFAHRLAELAAALPLDFKLHGRVAPTTRYILKQLARAHLPAAFVDRPKKGSGMPIGRWLRGDLRALAHDLLLDRASLAATGRLRRATIERLLADHAAARADHRQPLWTLLVLELWRRAHAIA